MRYDTAGLVYDHAAQPFGTRCLRCGLLVDLHAGRWARFRWRHRGRR